MSGPVIVTLQSSSPGLIIYTLLADSEKMLDPPHCLHWFLRRLCSYMLPPRNSLHYPQFYTVTRLYSSVRNQARVHHYARTQKKKQNHTPKEKNSVAIYVHAQSQKWYNWKVEKKCTNWAIVWKWAPRHILFEAVYLKRRDYSSSITRSEALPSITRPTAWAIWHNQSTQL
jgi:hypothetical protein